MQDGNPYASEVVEETKRKHSRMTVPQIAALCAPYLLGMIVFKICRFIVRELYRYDLIDGTTFTLFPLAITASVFGISLVAAFMFCSKRQET